MRPDNTTPHVGRMFFEERSTKFIPAGVILLLSGVLIAVETTADDKKGANATGVIEVLPVAPIEKPVAYRLKNGLRVVLQRNPRRPVVSVVIGYDVGTGDAPQGWRGLPHLVEHMMFNGSLHAPKSAFYYYALSGASYVNAITDSDHTIYQVRLPKENLQTALWLESDRMAYLPAGITDAALEIEKHTLQNEWYERVGNTLPQNYEYYVAKALYPEGHPYRQHIDNPKAFKALTSAQVVSFWQDWYGPDNAIVSIVGDIEIEKTRALVQKYFGSLKKRRRPAQQIPRTMPSSEKGKERATTISWIVRSERLDLIWRLPADKRSRAAQTFLKAYLRDELKPLLVETDMVANLKTEIWQRDFGSELRIRVYLKKNETADAARKHLLNALKKIAKKTYWKEALQTLAGPTARKSSTKKQRYDDLGDALRSLASQRGLDQSSSARVDRA